MIAFWILAFLIIVSALAVVLLSNPLYSALCLAINLVAVAGLYALLGSNFLSAVQIIVYAGAIMVLVVFVLMLLNAKSEVRTLKDWILSGIVFVAVSLLGFLFFPLIHQDFSEKQIWPTSDVLPDRTALIGQSIFGERFFIFQLTGVILITAIVGAVLLATQRKVPRSVGEK